MFLQLFLEELRAFPSHPLTNLPGQRLLLLEQVLWVVSSLAVCCLRDPVKKKRKKGHKYLDVLHL